MPTSLKVFIGFVIARLYFVERSNYKKDQLNADLLKQNIKLRGQVMNNSLKAASLRWRMSRRGNTPMEDLRVVNNIANQPW